MPPDELKVAIIVATTGNGHLFVEYLYMYIYVVWLNLLRIILRG
jgi:hypothetical protein